MTANCQNPGFVRTRILSGNSWGDLAMSALSPFTVAPEQGARTLLYLAMSPEVAETGGLYFYQCKPAKMAAAALDDAVAARLWDESARIVEQARG